MTFQNRAIRLAAVGGVALALAACSAQPTPGDTTAEANQTVAPPAANIDPARSNQAESMTIGGDGSQIILSALTQADLETVALEGELGCSFSTAQRAPVLVAKGNVASDERAFGIVKVAGYVESVSAPGGYDAMSRGTTFAGKGATIAVALTGPAIGGGESPPRPATLTYDRADGARRVFTGEWLCGP